MIEAASVAVRFSASVTIAVKPETPAADGVPDSAPVDASSVIPVGSDPELTDHT